MQKIDRGRDKKLENIADQSVRTNAVIFFKKICIQSLLIYLWH